MKLSILICHLQSREVSYRELELELLRQIEVHRAQSDVEILSETDNGEMSIGAKRNLLLSRAVGEYICFIDDDDMVSSDYIKKILSALETRPDCCSLQGRIYFSKGRRQGTSRIFKHSIKYKGWYEATGIYYRCPNHLNVVKRIYAMATLFPEIDNGEDKDYSFRLLPLLKTEIEIEGTIYFYKA